MSHQNDYLHEMRKDRALDDNTAEALLSGLAAPADRPDLQSLVSFFSELRSTATEPVPPPQEGLARIFAKGLTIDKGDLPVTAASKAYGSGFQTSGLPKWRIRDTVISLSSSLAARLASMSLTAKVGTGAAMALASFTAAAGAGALPAPVQNAVAQAVESVTPFSFPQGQPHVAARPATPAPSTPLDNKGLATAAKTPASAYVPKAIPAEPAAPANTYAPKYPTGQPAGSYSTQYQGTRSGNYTQNQGATYTPPATSTQSSQSGAPTAPATSTQSSQSGAPTAPATSTQSSQSAQTSTSTAPTSSSTGGTSSTSSW